MVLCAPGVFCRPWGCVYGCGFGLALEDFSGGLEAGIPDFLGDAEAGGDGEVFCGWMCGLPLVY